MRRDVIAPYFPTPRSGMKWNTQKPISKTCPRRPRCRSGPAKRYPTSECPQHQLLPTHRFVVLRLLRSPLSPRGGYRYAGSALRATFLTQIIDPAHQQVVAAPTQQVHRKKVRAARHPYASIVGHVARLDQPEPRRKKSGAIAGGHCAAWIPAQPSRAGHSMRRNFIAPYVPTRSSPHHHGAAIQNRHRPLDIQRKRCRWRLCVLQQFRKLYDPNPPN